MDASLNQGKTAKVELSAGDLRGMTRMVTEEALRVLVDPRGDAASRSSTQ
jgi:hypothetical protein